MTEIYEYAVSLSGTSGSHSGSLSSFQPLKFIYATWLIDYGLTAQAFNYLEQIASQERSSILFQNFDVSAKNRVFKVNLGPLIVKYLSETVNFQFFAYSYCNTVRLIIQLCRKLNNFKCSIQDLTLRHI